MLPTTVAAASTASTTLGRVWVCASKKASGGGNVAGEANDAERTEKVVKEIKEQKELVHARVNRWTMMGRGRPASLLPEVLGWGARA